MAKLITTQHERIPSCKQLIRNNLNPYCFTILAAGAEKMKLYAKLRNFS